MILERYVLRNVILNNGIWHLWHRVKHLACLKKSGIDKVHTNSLSKMFNSPIGWNNKLDRNSQNSLNVAE